MKQVFWLPKDLSNKLFINQITPAKYSWDILGKYWDFPRIILKNLLVFSVYFGKGTPSKLHLLESDFI